MQCLSFALRVLLLTQSLSTVAVSLCLIKTGFCCVKINPEVLQSQ